MELENALELIRRYRGPVTHIGLRKGGELYYILESTGETFDDLATRRKRELEEPCCDTRPD